MIDLTFLLENPSIAESVRLEIAGSDLLAFGKAIQKAATEEGKRDTPKEEYYCTEQIMNMLHVSHPTIWLWDKKGILKPVYMGRRKYYRKSDIEKILG